MDTSCRNNSRPTDTTTVTKVTTIDTNSTPLLSFNSNAELLVFVTGYNEENLKISLRTLILGWVRNSKYLSEGIFVFVLDKTNLVLDSCFKVTSKSFTRDLIWADENESNKIIYPNRWNVEIVREKINVPLQDINRIYPFPKVPFHKDDLREILES
jgi:hypothetical protein